MIPRFVFTRPEVRRSHYHRWGHQHADSPESPVQQTYQAPRSVRHHTVHDLQQDARPGGQGDSGDIEDRGLARRRPEALPQQDARLPDADLTQR